MWFAWFPPLFWCSYFGGYLLLKRPLPEDRDSGWSVFPSPCLVPQPACYPQVADWAVLTQINPSNKFHSRCPQLPWAAESTERMMTYPHSRLLGRGPHGIIRSLCQNSIPCTCPTKFHGSKVVISFSTSFPPQTTGLLPTSRNKVWVELLLVCLCVTMQVCFTVCPLAVFLSPPPPSLSLSLLRLLNTHHAQTEFLLLLCAGIRECVEGRAVV